ncbi:hypothetical protein SI65_04676 [Aspergillus cristatus]|uniref:NAD(P)-binding domain-containing protein n=1 Tax=Aspergillus cristatus TaxID=573508 RepID=A0A1E3BFE2_ASPCR|nr:hypothetical protein SI65_04676 [Aspergillus cristatus]
MHFLILGASGAIGSKFCDMALDQGHRLTLLVRNPSKLPDTILHNENINVIEGTLDNEAAIDQASRCGADAFISFAGPSPGTTGTPLTNGYKTLIPRLLRQNITRILVLSTPSYRSEPDTDSFKWKLGIWTIKIFCPKAYQEVTGIGEFVSSLCVADGVRWTVFRVGGLTNGAEESVKSTYVGSGEDGFWISRASVARWVLEEVIENKWVGRTPYICN